MHKKTYIMYKTHMHDTPPSPPISMHARTHTQHKRPKRSNRNWKQIPCAPQNLPKFSLQVSFSRSSFTSTWQSIFSCCWRSQVRPCAAAINAPCPTGNYRHHRVSQQPSIAKKTSPSATKNASQSLQNPTRKKNWRKNQWGASTWCLPRPAFACKHAPAHLSTRQITSVGRPRTSTPSAPHGPHELRVISVVLDAKPAHAQWPPSRSRVPTNAPSFVWRASMHTAGRKQRSLFLWTAAESKRIPSRSSCRSLHTQTLKHEKVNCPLGRRPRGSTGD